MGGWKDEGAVLTQHCWRQHRQQAPKTSTHLYVAGVALDAHQVAGTCTNASECMVSRGIGVGLIPRARKAGGGRARARMVR